MATPAIKIIPTNSQDVLALRHSDALRAVETAIATQAGQRFVEDDASALTSRDSD
jgi:hypothetical protein